MKLDLLHLRSRIGARRRFVQVAEPECSTQDPEMPFPKGAEMIIAEATISTSMTASMSVDLPELARKTAVCLVLSATKSLHQATLSWEFTPAGRARATVRAMEPENASVSLTVTTMATQRAEGDQIRMVSKVDIDVRTETPVRSQEIIDALLASVPNRIVKPVVVVRSPRAPKYLCASDATAWRELHAWRQARG